MRVMRERVFTHVSTRLRKAAFPLPPCPVVSQNSAFRKTTRGVFPKSSLVFDDTPQVSKFASFSSVMVCISRIVFLPLPSKDTQFSALRSAARPLCLRLPYALGIDDTHDAPHFGMAHVDSSSHTWLAEQKRGNAQELAVMSVLSFREINGKNYNSL